MKQIMSMVRGAQTPAAALASPTVYCSAHNSTRVHLLCTHRRTQLTKQLAVMSLPQIAVA